MVHKRIIMHIDMDSYFATVEQQANPCLRGKPIVVSGKEGSRSVIVASSREAKLLGIKTGLLQHEARALCPHLIFALPDGAKYEYLHRQFFEIFKQFTEKVQIFSIDEAFLDVSSRNLTNVGAILIARQIKEKMRQVLGDWVSCSVGIAENKLLAKIASDLDKPNGLVVVDEVNKMPILDKLKLTDFCGIGRQISRRLCSLGVESVPRLREYPVVELIAEFGPCYGQKLHDMSLGIDNDEVIPYFENEAIKSVSRSYTLAANTYDKEEILVVLLHLIESATRDLRDKGLFGKTIVIYLRYSDFTHSGIRQTLSGFTNSSDKIFAVAANKLAQFKLKKSVRLVGVHISNLISGYEQQSLWREERQREDLGEYLDKINDRYGELTIKPAFLLKLDRLKHKVGGFKPNLID